MFQPSNIDRRSRRDSVNRRLRGIERERERDRNREREGEIREQSLSWEMHLVSLRWFMNIILECCLVGCSGGGEKGFWRSSSDSTLGNVTATGAIAGVGGTGGKNNNLCRNIFSSSKL